MMAVPQSGFVIYAKDPRRLADFYARVAGLAVMDANDDFVVLESTATQMVIVRMPREIAESIILTDPPTLREDTPIKPVLYVSSLAAARAAAARTSGRIKPPEAEWSFRDVRGVDGYDPEGNVFRLQESMPAHERK
jgi:predicted enzyme related to lactoylglutathione lyase